MSLIKKIKNSINFNLSKIKLNEKNRHYFIFIIIFFVSALACIFVMNNHGLYNKPIAKITQIEQITSKNREDVFGYKEDYYYQKINAKIMNGTHKGEEITFENSASYSQALDFKFKIKDEVFLILKEDANGEIISAIPSDLKRDKYIVIVAVIFVLTIILVGKRKGCLSLISLIFNIIIVFAIIYFYSKGINIILLAIFATLIFVVLSIFLVSGIEKKSISAIISTLIGTAFSMGIALFVMFLTKSKGVYFEEMEFILANPRKIFIAQILIGNLGGIMDIAVSLSSAIKEMYQVNPHIEKATISKSAKSIGSDIMGTMSNTLVFAYISGSLPMILLLLKNGYSPFYIIENNISLEMIRALIGSIGMVLSIPISWRFAVLFLKKKRVNLI